jgi:hypothetical protein
MADFGCPAAGLQKRMGFGGGCRIAVLSGCTPVRQAPKARAFAESACRNLLLPWRSFSKRPRVNPFDGHWPDYLQQKNETSRPAVGPL